MSGGLVRWPTGTASATGPLRQDGALPLGTPPSCRTPREEMDKELLRATTSDLGRKMACHSGGFVGRRHDC